MSTDNTQYYKLASIVDNWLFENDLPNGYFAKGLVWIIRGLRELSLDTFQDVKTKIISVSDVNTVILPDGFVDWAVISSTGSRPITLGVNSELSLIPDPQESKDHQRSDPGYWLFNFDSGKVFSYGLGMYPKGSFRVRDDGVCKRLLMDLNTRYSEVYLEYITDGFDPCEETVVSPYFYDYLMKYIEHKYEEKNNPARTEASIYRKSEDVFYALKNVRARKNNLDPQTLLNLSRQYTSYYSLNA